MKIINSYHYDKGYREHKAIGDFNVPDYLVFVKSLIDDPDYDDSYNALWDVRESSYANISPEQLTELVKINNNNVHYTKDVKLAFVCSTDLDFGLLRQFETHRKLLARDVIHISIFRDYDNAVAWLVEGN
jgi:hypothetical protein